MAAGQGQQPVRYLFADSEPGAGRRCQQPGQWMVFAGTERGVDVAVEAVMTGTVTRIPLS